MRTVDIISGGFPCQPFSVAGKQLGINDERFLWPEMLRIVCELAPRWVVAENVPGILPIAGDVVCKGLERAGYSVAVFRYEAAAVGAPHRRDRVFFVADAGSGGLREQGFRRQQQRRTETIGASKIMGDAKHNGRVAATIGGFDFENASGCTEGAQQAVEPAGASTTGSDGDVADAESQRQQGDWPIWEQIAGTRHEKKESERCRDRSGWWAVEPGLGRVADGATDTVDRLRCLGNAVVPQQAYPIFKAIAEIECEESLYL